MPNLNATLLASVNGGAPASGAQTAALGDEVQFSFLNTVGWSGARLELHAPPDFPTPAGWTASTVDGHTTFYVLGRTPPAPVTLSVWGKYMTRLVVNGGLAVDETTAISVPSPNGLLDLGHREAGQFGGSAEKWVHDQRENLRVIEAYFDAGGGGGGGGGVPTSRTLIAGAGLTGGGDLSANRTFDVVATDGSIAVASNGISVGVLQSDGQHGNRGGGALHAVANGTDTGFMSAAHYTAVQGATATPTAGAIALYGTGNSLAAEFVQVGDQGAFADEGDIRGDEDFSIYAIKSDTSVVRVLEVNNSTLILGDQNNALTPEIRSAANTGVAFRHGASLVTYFKPLPSGTCSAPGHIRLDATTGLAYVWSTTAGAEVQLGVGNARWDVVFGAASAQYAGSPRYMQPGMASSTSALAGAATARACVATSISICCAGPGTGSGSYVFTLFKIDASTGAVTTTSLAVTIAATARAAIATGSVSLNAGDLYGVQYVVTGSVTTSMTNVTATVGFTG